MPLGTLDRSPPPFFRQGTSALTKLVFFTALAIFLMAADTRFALVKPLRDGLAMALHYPQRALRLPVEGWHTSVDYLAGLQHAVLRRDAAERELAALSERAARTEILEQENERLRALLDLRERLQVRSQAAEVLYEASDPYSLKVVIDRGSQHGVASGSPVMNESGVLGQVTRVYPLSSEVTLLSDKDSAIPLLNTRTQQRNVAYGLAGGATMELRFVAPNADVQIGDTLTTSGVDAVYPPGMPVGHVLSVDRRAEAGFARIVIGLDAVPDGVRHVLVLEPVGVQLPPPPAAPASAPAPAPAPAASAPPPRKGARR